MNFEKRKFREKLTKIVKKGRFFRIFGKFYKKFYLHICIKNDKDWSTNRRVQDFNRIIFNECVYRRYHFIEVFYPFTKFRRQRNEPVSRFDRLFERGGIHPNPERGMGVLARFYIRALHSKFFNPCVFQ